MIYKSLIYLIYNYIMEDISYVNNRRRFSRYYPDYGYPYIGRYYADPQAIAPRQSCQNRIQINPYVYPAPQGTTFVNPYISEGVALASPYQVPLRYNNLVDPFENPYRNPYYNPYYNGPYVYQPYNSPYVSYISRTNAFTANPYTGLYNPYYLY